MEIDFQLTEIVSVHGGGIVYSVSYCDIIPTLWTYFATVANRTASLFSIEADDSCRAVKSFITEDRDEEYYSWFVLWFVTLLDEFL